MKLLVLMSDTGGGHRSAAEAIAAALGQLEPDARVELVDFFSTCAPFPLNQAGRVYGPWVNYAAPLWAAGFHLTDGRRRAAALGWVISRVTWRCVAERVRRFAPDVLACVHPLATRLAGHVRRQLHADWPLVTIVTDLVIAHAAWFTREVDLLTAPSEAVRVGAIRAGIPAEKIALTGQPVHPRFTALAAGPCTTRRELGLDPDRFTVLLIGGGEGMGRVAEMAEAVDAAGLPLQQMVVCGRNRALQRRLERHAWRGSVQVLGFVRNMPDLMHAADVVVTKAGPSTICEALVVGRPILLTGYVPGQERGNVDYVVEAGAGLLTEAPEELVAALCQLVDAAGGARDCLTAGARRLARPSAAWDIASLVRNL